MSTPVFVALLVFTGTLQYASSARQPSMSEMMAEIKKFSEKLVRVEKDVAEIRGTIRNAKNDVDHHVDDNLARMEKKIDQCLAKKGLAKKDEEDFFGFEI